VNVLIKTRSLSVPPISDKVSRKFGIKRALVLLVLLLAIGEPGTAFAAPAAGNFLVYVGTYTAKDSKGIYAYRFEASTGKLTPIGLAAATENPSYVVLHPNGRFLYAVNELQTYNGKNSGAVSAFAIDRTSGKLTLLNQVASGGADPCYLSFDKSGKHLLVANYTGGSVSVFPIMEDGKLGETSAFMQHKGSSVNSERQEGPHAHSIELSFDNRFAMVSDLGLDEILVDRFDRNKATLTPNDPPFTKVDPGSGPRHFKFHPNGNWGYLISELRNTVTVYSYHSKNGTLHTQQTISALPKDFTGHSEAAEIQIDSSGKFLYASNRGYDSVAVFKIDPANGTLSNVEIVPSGGKSPRYFTIDPSGSRLFVANEDSGNIVLFKVDQSTGRIMPTGEELKLDSPVCIQFLAVK
jgi:6-phosphogluconolactonase